MKKLLLIPAALFIMVSCGEAKKENHEYHDTSIMAPHDTVATDTNTIREKAKKLDEKLEGESNGTHQGDK